MAEFPRRGQLRAPPERNLREGDPVADRNNLSSTEDRAPALACPLLQGRAITSFSDPITGNVTNHVIVPAGGQVAIPHGLQRPIRGWFVTRNGNAAGTGDTVPVELAGTDADYLILGNVSGVDLRIDLWVF